MPKKDLEELRVKLEQHLEDSGLIRADISWLKKAFWTLAGAGLTFNITLIVGVILYLLNHK